MLPKKEPVIWSVHPSVEDAYDHYQFLRGRTMRLTTYDDPE
jgi:hypothetical protein